MGWGGSEDFYVTAIKDIYEMICLIGENYKKQYKC